jgi:hypothetical protein
METITLPKSRLVRFLVDRGLSPNLSASAGSKSKSFSIESSPEHFGGFLE